MAAQPVSVTIAENPAATDNPILDFFLTYWAAKRGTRAMPSRADIAPADLKEHLGWLCFLDVLPEREDFRFRLIGSRVADYFLADATGHTVREAYGAAKAGSIATDSVLWILRKTCASRTPLRVTGGGGEWRGHYFPDYDALYLPLSENGATANMVMCIFTFHYQAYLKTRSLSAMTKRG
ncbi:MAG: PAS domain-containing protein [Rhizomicrobium sp.]